MLAQSRLRWFYVRWKWMNTMGVLVKAYVSCEMDCIGGFYRLLQYQYSMDTLSATLAYCVETIFF